MIADLVAKLDEVLEHRERCGRWDTCPSCETADELKVAELRAIVVAAQAYVELDEGSSPMKDIADAYDELVAAVRGEA